MPLFLCSSCTYWFTNHYWRQLEMTRDYWWLVEIAGGYLLFFSPLLMLMDCREPPIPWNPAEEPGVQMEGHESGLYSEHTKAVSALSSQVPRVTACCDLLTRDKLSRDQLPCDQFLQEHLFMKTTLRRSTLIKLSPLKSTQKKKTDEILRQLECILTPHASSLWTCCQTRQIDLICWL